MSDWNASTYESDAQAACRVSDESAAVYGDGWYETLNAAYAYVREQAAIPADASPDRLTLREHHIIRLLARWHLDRTSGSH